MGLAGGGRGWLETSPMPLPTNGQGLIGPQSDRTEVELLAKHGRGSFWTPESEVQMRVSDGSRLRALLWG